MFNKDCSEGMFQAAWRELVRWNPVHTKGPLTGST